MAYSFTAKWCKGNAHAAPDALSHHPVLAPTQEDSMAEVRENHNLEPSITEIQTLQSTTSDSLWLTELREQASKDQEYTLS